MKRMLCLLLSLMLLMGLLPWNSLAAENERTLNILFTHDIHSYFMPTESYRDGQTYEHGGAARLKMLIDQNSDENTVYVDAGDFSMGTLLQAGYATEAFELRLLGRLGCAVTTLGNHEFDFAGTGAAQMLRSALASGDPLPEMVQANIDFTGELTQEQQTLRDALDEYNAKPFTFVEVNGLKVAFFGLLGISGIEDSPTSGMKFVPYIDAAKETVKAIKAEGADVIVCLSHCGTSGDGKKGEDIDLAKAVPDIDVIISGHSHTTYPSPVTVGNTLIVSAGEYLTNLGMLSLTVSSDAICCVDYQLISCDETVPEDADIAQVVEQYKQSIRETYLAKENCDFDQVICHSDFDFMPLDEMYATHQEYPMGDLIADSYLYEAHRNGINDIDVALVGLGTIRGSIHQGDITVADAFEICSLGVGADGSAGHPLLAAYLTGQELKLIVELDASLGTLVSSIKMSYSGLRYTFNPRRLLLNRAYATHLVREDGTMEEIEDDKLYKVVCNLYAANMLGMLNGLTRGILSIVPKDANGEPVDSFYDYSLYNTEGDEIKEWVAFMNYLSSFPEQNGVPTIPEHYASADGRKEKVQLGGLALLTEPGRFTIILNVLFLLLLVLIIVLISTRKIRKARRIAKRQRRVMYKEAK